MTRLSKLPLLAVALATALVVGLLGGAAIAQTGGWEKPGDDVLSSADADAALMWWNNIAPDDSPDNRKLWDAFGEMADNLMVFEATGGNTGPAGAKGDKGAPGADGADGEPGAKGDPGADGAGADPAVTEDLEARIAALEEALGAHETSIAALEEGLSSHEANASNPHEVTNDQVGLGNVANTKMNLAAIANPAPTDDSSGGYSVGSVWVNTSTGAVFVLVDVSEAAAIWREITNDNQQLICDGFVNEHITVDTTVYVPSFCDGVIWIEDGLFLGQRRSISTAGPGSIEILDLRPLTEPGGQIRTFFFTPTGQTVIWEWGISGWVVVFESGGAL